MWDRIEINPRVCNGKPVIRGTRIPVRVILDQVATGESWDSILRNYPALNREDLAAAVEFARDAVERTEIRESPAA